jgi:hypothetical protein
LLSCWILEVLSLKFYSYSTFQSLNLNSGWVEHWFQCLKSAVWYKKYNFVIFQLLWIKVDHPLVDKTTWDCEEGVGSNPTSSISRVNSTFYFYFAALSLQLKSKSTCEVFLHWRLNYNRLEFWFCDCWILIAWIQEDCIE